MKVRVALYIGISLCLLTAGFLVGRLSKGRRPEPNALSKPDCGTALKPGPWGNLSSIPMVIAALDQMLPVRGLEAAKTLWSFELRSRDELARHLDSIGVPAGLRDDMLAPASLTVLPEAVVVAPSTSVIFSMPPPARLEIYKASLRNNKLNGNSVVVVPEEGLAESLRAAGLPPESIARFNQLSCPCKGYRLFSGISQFLTALPDYAQKARFAKILSRQQTMLLRLHVAPDSDINALMTYWAKACWNTDVKALLESLAHVPGGAWVDIAELLPPLPSSMLYTFPVPDNPMNGPPVARDCIWTAFNFFRNPADNHFADPNYIIAKLKEEYFPVPNDPRFGDVVLFVAGNRIHHATVFIADDVVYTKNGDSSIHPWLLSTIPELRNRYNLILSGDERLQVLYFRNKYY